MNNGIPRGVSRPIKVNYSSATEDSKKELNESSLNSPDLKVAKQTVRDLNAQGQAALDEKKSLNSPQGNVPKQGFEPPQEIGELFPIEGQGIWFPCDFVEHQHELLEVGPNAKITLYENRLYSKTQNTLPPRIDADSQTSIPPIDENSDAYSDSDAASNATDGGFQRPRINLRR